FTRTTHATTGLRRQPPAATAMAATQTPAVPHHGPAALLLPKMIDAVMRSATASPVYPADSSSAEPLQPACAARVPPDASFGWSSALSSAAAGRRCAVASADVPRAETADASLRLVPPGRASASPASASAGTASGGVSAAAFPLLSAVASAGSAGAVAAGSAI